MDLLLLLLAALVVGVAVLVLLARFSPGSGADILDMNPEERMAARVEAEEEDMAQLLDLENQERRRRGHGEVTEDGLRDRLEP